MIELSKILAVAEDNLGDIITLCILSNSCEYLDEPDRTIALSYIDSSIQWQSAKKRGFTDVEIANVLISGLSNKELPVISSRLIARNSIGKHFRNYSLSVN